MTKRVKILDYTQLNKDGRIRYCVNIIVFLIKTEIIGKWSSLHILSVRFGWGDIFKLFTPNKLPE